jgi:hypothetical protein
MVPENVAVDKLANFLEFKNRLARHVHEVNKKPYTFQLTFLHNFAFTIYSGEKLD